MRKLNWTPQGEPKDSYSWNDEVVPKPKPTGWRKPTPALCAAEQYAKTGEGLNVPKNKALLAIKRVAAHLGLKPSDMMLLDTFGAFTKPQDWEQGRRPIIWASNAYLMEQTGFSLSALKRHARRLVDAGLISFRDSTNGKRWGHRDDQGYIIEAYGFDLSPLAARAEEFEQLFAQIQDNRKLCQRAKRQITIVRRTIRSMVNQALENALQGPWKELTNSFEALLGKLPRGNATPARLLDMLEKLSELKQKVETLFQNAFEPEDDLVDNSCDSHGETTGNTSKMNPTGTGNEPHILNTKQLNPVKSNRLESKKRENAKQTNNPRTLLETDDVEWSTFGRKNRNGKVDIATIMQSCPDFANVSKNLGGYVNDWAQLHRLAGQLRPMMGITENAWDLAQQILGPQTAAAALALIFDKFSAGEVASPGGYLRGIVEKARAGELHLARSFYGRLNEVRAA